MNRLFEKSKTEYSSTKKVRTTAYTIEGIICINVLTGILIFYLYNTIVTTYTGHDGIKQINRCLVIIFVLRTVGVILFPIIAECAVRLYLKCSCNENYCSPHKRIVGNFIKSIILVYLFTSLNLGYSYKIQNQKNNYPDMVIISDFMLMIDTGRDLISGETISVNEDYIKLMPGDVNSDPYFADENGNIIVQISPEDLNMISNPDFYNQPHCFHLYKHSGFIESVDGMTFKEAVEITKGQDNIE